MNDVAVALDTTLTQAVSYGGSRPRLLLVHEETGLACQAGEPVARTGKPGGLPMAPSEGPTGEPGGLPMAPSEGSGEAPADEPETVSDWSRVHARVVELGAERAAHERELCRWLLAAERLGVHARAGYASLREYAGRLVGLSGRQTEERLRVGRVLAELPRLDEALSAGELSFSAARELSQVARPETEQEWLDWAGGKSSRQIERALAARRPGDGPRAQGDPALVTHRLRFEVRAETMALFRDLQTSVRRDLGGDVDDDTLLCEIARRALGGPDEEGRSSYQVALTRCEMCGQASIDAGGQSHLVEQDVVAMATCDSQELGSVDDDAVEEGDDGDHGDSRSCPHVGAEHGAATRHRASQTVPPAVRRAVMRRHRSLRSRFGVPTCASRTSPLHDQRCAMPGCANHRFLDVHHLDPRAEGGSHDPERLVVLCSHHRSAHSGSLCVDGSAGEGFSFRHADGTPYGQPLRPAALDLAAQAFSTLRHLGFGQARARALVDTVGATSAPDDLGSFVRAALQAS